MKIPPPVSKLLKRLGVSLKEPTTASKNVTAGVFFEVVDDTIPENGCDESDDEELSRSTPTFSPPVSWKSTNRRSFLKGQPLCVSDPDDPTEEIVDAAEALGKKMKRAKDLPGTWYYSSNHVMVNLERRNHFVAPLSRRAELDSLAREHAAVMAREGRLSHSDPFRLHNALATNSRIVGENVATGDNIREIHSQMMENQEQKSNVLHRRYTHFGMGTAKTSDGRLFLCQLYRG
jgi:Cysteine-rich secretory protein family